MLLLSRRGLAEDMCILQIGLIALLHQLGRRTILGYNLLLLIDEGYLLQLLLVVTLRWLALVHEQMQGVLLLVCVLLIDVNLSGRHHVVLLRVYTYLTRLRGGCLLCRDTNGRTETWDLRLG